MSADCDIVNRNTTKLPGHKLISARLVLDSEHTFRCTIIKGSVQPENELAGRRLSELTGNELRVKLSLHLDMRSRLDLEVASRVVIVEIALQCPFDIGRSCVVPFDQVAVVAVHHADEIGETGSSLWVQTAAE